jgi:hypothetical protein
MAPPIRLYVAADYARMEDARLLLKLAAMHVDIEPCCRWVADGTPGDGLGGGLSLEEAGLAEAAGLDDLEDIDASELFIQLTTGELARGGRQVELGYAIAMSKSILVVGPKEHVFHYHPIVQQVTTNGEALAWLAGYLRRH